MKKIWILWGMWPQASLHFYHMLIEKSQKNTEMRNQDYPYICLYNIPVPDMIQWQDTLEVTVSMVQEAAKNLEKSWVDIIVMPCNTMHLFKREIMDWIKTPFLCMIDSVVSKVIWGNIQSVWLLWSSTTMNSNLYNWPLNHNNITCIVPDTSEHENISHIIKEYISWRPQKQDIDYLDSLCQKLINCWAQGIILWCTELPLIMNELFPKYNFFISSEILAENCLKYYSI
jgi:aspartate racemase